MNAVATQPNSSHHHGWPEVDTLPVDWTVSRLSDCGEVIMGQSPAGASYNRSGVGHPLINGPTEFTDLHPTKIQWTTQPARFCKPGDLLICVRGSSTGRTNYADDTYAIGRGVAAIRARDKNDTQFISYQVISGVSDVLEAATGSTFPSVNGASFRKIIVPLPPPTEQHAIAEALSDVDGLLSALDALIAKKRAVKRAAMQQLLTGKTRLPGFSGEWGTKTFGEVFKRLNGKAHQIQTSEYDIHGFHPVIDQGRSLVVAFSDRTEKLFECPIGGLIVFGDHTRIVKFINEDFLIGADGTQILAIQGRGVTKFFFYQLSTKDIPNTGYNRHFKFLKDLTFAVPLPNEQHAIAAVLSDMDAEIAALEKRRDKTPAIKQGMMQALLTGRVRLVKPETASEHEAETITSERRDERLKT